MEPDRGVDTMVAGASEFGYQTFCCGASYTAMQPDFIQDCSETAASLFGNGSLWALLTAIVAYIKNDISSCTEV
ncbi:MAG: hypothetical protein JWL65_6317 [Gammaproteobacteria bacterium]|nr:hypothetical protein [Gammaproteobacteria bacterium]